MIRSKCIFLLLITWFIYILCTIFVRTDMLYPSFKTELLLVCFLLSLALGAIFYENISSNKEILKFYRISLPGVQILKKLVYVNALLSAVVLARYLVYRFIFNDILTRAQLYSPIAADGRVLSIIYVLCLYLKGITSVILLFSFLKALLDMDTKLILVSVSIILLDAIVFAAKGPVINIGFVFLLYVIIKSKQESTLFKKMVICCTLIILVLWCIELIRGNNIIDSFVRYFSIGPVLLASIVDGGFEAGYRTWSPANIFLIFSGLDYLIVIFARGVSELPIQSVGYDWVKYIDMPIAIAEVGHKFFPSNTFYTILSEPYLSFGFAGVVGLGLLLGWVVTSLERGYQLNKCERDLFWLQYIVGIAFFGIFVSAMSTVIFWLILILMLFFSSYVFHDYKP
jgi:oligosaccharide repeat unit polymerase